MCHILIFKPFLLLLPLEGKARLWPRNILHKFYHDIGSKHLRVEGISKAEAITLQDSDSAELNETLTKQNDAPEVTTTTTAPEI